jgi:hypothetical protein
LASIATKTPTTAKKNPAQGELNTAQMQHRIKHKADKEICT